MKEISTILVLLMLLSSCGQNTVVNESPPKEMPAVSSEEPTACAETAPIVSTAAPAAQVTTAVEQGTMSEKAEPVSTAEKMVQVAETDEADTAAQAPEELQASAEPEEEQTSSSAEEVPVQQTVPPVTAVIVTEPCTEPETDCTGDYEKAEAVYGYMRQNGYGTCVNFACQTYEKCSDVGLSCYIVWTDAGIYGHVANIVKVDGTWYVLDTEGGTFLDYNYGFTEVVDIEGNHIADGSIISDHRYAESR